MTTLDYKSLPKTIKNEMAISIHSCLLNAEVLEDMDMEMRLWRQHIEQFIGDDYQFADRDVINYDSRSLFDIMYKDNGLFTRSAEPVNKRYTYKINKNGSKFKNPYSAETLTFA